jgi:hypothetical protein
MERKVVDKFGLELNAGDNVCFTLSMRKDSKPIVKAKVCEVKAGTKPNYDGVFTDWVVVEYYDSPEAEWGKREGKLPKKVTPDRVVKCY